QPRLRRVDGRGIRAQEREPDRLVERRRDLEEGDLHVALAGLHAKTHVPVVVRMIPFFALCRADAQTLIDLGDRGARPWRLRPRIGPSLPGPARSRPAASLRRRTI